MNFLEKHSKKIAFALCVATCVPVVSAVYAYEAQPGWHGEGSDRYYILESTHEQAIGWLKIDEGTYYFNDEGEMLLGWQTIDENTYYFDGNGKMVTGEQKIDEENYFFQEDGRLLKGWQDDVLYDDHGYVTTGQYVEIKEDTYVYVDENGQKVTGWKTINGKKHYFDDDGIMASGKTKIGNDTYYLDEYGVLYTGWDYDEDGNAYYRNKYGKILKDTMQEIDGVEYVFSEDGVAKEAKSALGSSIAEAALAQVGTTQDCTMLVTNALAANGIYFHGWPAEYMSLGTITSDPQPGDLIYYADGGLGMAHIAVYIGNGQAVHGGWHGNGTVVYSAYCGSGPVFIHVD